MRSGGIVPLLNLGTRWMWVVSFKPRPLYSGGTIPLYSMNRRLDGPQNWSESVGGNNFRHCPGRESNACRPNRNLVSILIKLPRSQKAVLILVVCLCLDSCVIFRRHTSFYKERQGLAWLYVWCASYNFELMNIMPLEAKPPFLLRNSLHSVIPKWLS